MEVEKLRRKVSYKGNELKDIEGITPQQMVKHYAGVYPEITNAKIEYKGIENNTEIWEISASAGIKG